jgi:hypothetical protein
MSLITRTTVKHNTNVYGRRLASFPGKSTIQRFFPRQYKVSPCLLSAQRKRGPWTVQGRVEANDLKVNVTRPFRH